MFSIYCFVMSHLVGGHLGRRRCFCELNWDFLFVGFSRIPSSPLFFFFFRLRHRRASFASSLSWSCHRCPRGGLAPLDLGSMVSRTGRHPLCWFTLLSCRLEARTSRVFQPCCLIAGWVRSPWPSSNPQKNGIFFYYLHHLFKYAPFSHFGSSPFLWSMK